MRKVEQEIDWEKMFSFSELITLGLIVIVGIPVFINAILIVFYNETFTIPSGSLFAPLYLLCGLAMPIAGIANFLISRRTRATKLHIKLCFIVALLIFVFLITQIKVVLLYS